MNTNFKNLFKIIPVFLTAALITTVGYAQPAEGMKGDVTGERMIKIGAEQMMSAKHQIMATLEKLDQTKEPPVAEGIAMLTAGEKMIMDGKAMMQDPTTRIKGKELMMEGGTKMMEGKDYIMNELRKQGMLKASALEAQEQELINGENQMLDGKNLMMDGERNFM